MTPGVHYWFIILDRVTKQCMGLHCYALTVTLLAVISYNNLNAL